MSKFNFTMTFLVTALLSLTANADCNQSYEASLMKIKQELPQLTKRVERAVEYKQGAESFKNTAPFLTTVSIFYPPAWISVGLGYASAIFGQDTEAAQALAKAEYAKASAELGAIVYRELKLNHVSGPALIKLTIDTAEYANASGKSAPSEQEVADYLLSLDTTDKCMSQIPYIAESLKHFVDGRSQ